MLVGPVLVVCMLAALPPTTATTGKVLELSDKFLPLRKEGVWLMKFYAPWCGHCKKLEPVWKHVAQSLVDTPVRVGRVDCTRFTKVATEFSIRGYPTIVFLKGEEVWTYEGDRSREEIVAFARRMMGPPVQQIHNNRDLEQARLNTLFFLYAGLPEHPLHQQFLLNAKHFQKDELMYSTSLELLSEQLGDTAEPGVYVYKDGGFTQFPAEEVVGRQEREAAEEEDEANKPPITVTNTSLYSWVMAERFPLFVKVTRGKFSNILASRKFIVMAVLEENKLLEISPEMEQFKQMLQQVIIKNKEKYHSQFQFGWTGSPDLANSVAMETLSLPSLLVINSTNYKFHMPDDPAHHLTPEAVQIFLDSVADGNAPAFGGSSWLVRMYRAYYEAKSALVEMWRGNPVLTAVLIGLPLGFLSLIFYSICCADIMDAEEEEEDESEYHEKAE